MAHRLLISAALSLFRHKSFGILCAVFALLVFSGDIVADARGGCVSACSQQSGCADDCTVCLTCSLGGALLAAGTTSCALPLLGSFEKIVLADEHILDGPPTRIDHPPQLA